MTTMLERTRMILRGEAPPPPIATLLGFTLTAVGEGEATIELKVDERLANPMGTLHGGVLVRHRRRGDGHGLGQHARRG